MDELHDYKKRMEIENLISYIMYGTDDCTIGKSEKSYRERLDDAYEKFFDRIEEQYPVVNRNQDDFHSMVMELTLNQNALYLEMGVLVAFQLYKNMEAKSTDVKMDEIKDMLERLMEHKKE